MGSWIAPVSVKFHTPGAHTIKNLKSNWIFPKIEQTKQNKN